MELYINHVPDVYTRNKLWWQNISDLLKIFIMDVFQIAKAELKSFWRDSI